MSVSCVSQVLPFLQRKGTDKCKGKCTVVYVGTCVCVCVCVYIYIYTHTHIHTHTWYGLPHSVTRR